MPMSVSEIMCFIAKACQKAAHSCSDCRALDRRCWGACQRENSPPILAPSGGLGAPHSPELEQKQLRPVHRPQGARRHSERMARPRKAGCAYIECTLGVTTLGTHGQPAGV